MAAPVFVGLDNNPQFTENGASVVLDNNATVTDADLTLGSSVSGATLTLARASQASPDDLFLSGLFDENQVIVSGNPVGTFENSAGTLTITFNDSAVLSDVNTVLQSLQYLNGSDSPPPSVEIDYTFNDGDVATGRIIVGITAVNDPPSIESAVPAFYRPGSAGVLLSPGIMPGDVDGNTLVSATVSLSAHDTTDLLSADVGATGIVANYDSSTGVLTLSGSASIEAYREVLASVTYSSSAADPTSFGVPRIVTWEVNDGLPSGTIDSTLYFTPVLDLDQSGAGTGFATTFTQGGGAVAIADTDDHIIAGGTAIATATVTLTNPEPGDTLSVGGVSSQLAVDQSVPGTITFTNRGLASTADFTSALHLVTFDNTNAVVDPTTRDVTVVVADLNTVSNTAHTSITVSAVNHPGSATDDSATTPQDTSLSVDATHGVLANDNDPDGLAVITGSVATSQGGSIQFASDGSYSYTPMAHFVGTDTVGYTAQDPFGSQVSATLSITVTPVNHAPVLDHALADQSFAVNHDFDFTVPGTSFSDPDSDPLTYAATLANGDPLPAWVQFDAGTLHFSGTPATNFVGDLDIKVVASDGALTASDDFLLGFSNAGNDLFLSGTGTGSTSNDPGIFPLAGGAGNDTYLIQDDQAQVLENPGAGSDTVYSGVTFTTPQNVEGMVLLESGGAIDATGTDGNDTIIGNSFANTLNGGAGTDALSGGGGDDVLIGGPGADGMAGGTGNDTYSVDDPGDQVAENPGEGQDTVYASVSYVLPANVEGLVLTEAGGAINGVGNALDNYILGNSAANSLNGGGGNDVLFGGGGNDTLIGGAGDDVLVGGAGNDYFAFAPAMFGHDTITDFTPGDQIVFDHTLFANFADVQAHETQVGADTVIVHDAANTLTLSNVAATSLTAHDFLIV